MAYWAHPSACIDPPVDIGARTKIWHFCHVMAGAVIGADCALGQNVFVASTARIGRHVRVQNNVSVYDGVVLEDEVFCGPSCVFTNVSNPRAELNRRDKFERTIVRRGATIGANATIVSGTEIGRYAFVAAGAVVSRSKIPDYALVLGVPGRITGWVSRHGHVLRDREADGTLRCPESGWRYGEVEAGVLRCLDHDESSPL